MRRSISKADAGRAFGRRGGWLAGLALAGAMGIGAASPVAAQWIGAPGGSGGDAPVQAAPEAPVAPISTPAPSSVPPSSMAPADPPMQGFSPGMMSPGPMMPPAGGMAPASRPAGPDQAAMQDCQTSVEKLRGAIEKSGSTIQVATNKKRPPSDLCPMFRNYVSAQQKFQSYLSANKAKCGVPDEVLTKLGQSVREMASVRDKVCQAAQQQASGGPSGPPPQGAVSAGLGLPSGLPSSANSRPGGVFDTLGGNALR